MITFDITCFHSWSSVDHKTEYVLRQLEKNRARRFPAVDKIIIDLALQSLASNPPVSAIFYASRHGELGYSYELIKNISQGKSLSPTKFSQSVHNSIPSFITIEKLQHIPVSAIAAGQDSFLMGLVAGLNFCQSNPQQQVLYIFSDAKVPSVYKEKLTEPDEDTAIACILKLGSAYTLDKQQLNFSTLSYNERLQSIDFINWMNCNATTPLRIGHSSSWLLSKLNKE